MTDVRVASQVASSEEMLGLSGEARLPEQRECPVCNKDRVSSLRNKEEKALVCLGTRSGTWASWAGSVEDRSAREIKKDAPESGIPRARCWIWARIWKQSRDLESVHGSRDGHQNQSRLGS
jgi:hypothetical protein